jgi:hypothetical protein
VSRQVDGSWRVGQPSRPAFVWQCALVCCVLLCLCGIVCLVAVLRAAVFPAHRWLGQSLQGYSKQLNAQQQHSSGQLVPSASSAPQACSLPSAWWSGCKFSSAHCPARNRGVSVCRACLALSVLDLFVLPTGGSCAACLLAVSTMHSVACDCVLGRVFVDGKRHLAWLSTDMYSMV